MPRLRRRDHSLPVGPAFCCGLPLRPIGPRFGYELWERYGVWIAGLAAVVSAFLCAGRSSAWLSKSKESCSHTVNWDRRDRFPKAVGSSASAPYRGGLPFLPPSALCAQCALAGQKLDLVLARIAPLLAELLEHPPLPLPLPPGVSLTHAPKRLFRNPLTLLLTSVVLRCQNLRVDSRSFPTKSVGLFRSGDRRRLPQETLPCEVLPSASRWWILVGLPPLITKFLGFYPVWSLLGINTCRGSLQRKRRIAHRARTFREEERRREHKSRLSEPGLFFVHFLCSHSTSTDVFLLGNVSIHS
ncbi:hypothetical protein MAMT_00562 [Methylacidimicrobium tartarophylax]|uniref:Uncharacterized protein n=1 Tax=Methylacidimicrobium tartarophylax TaxID=1041768 RepID=A0A5E6MAC2_9BACT|nr:hypothetical protein MAMT_00562 [Methylacidimicrobium tartarophylax]